jgi:outer membrane autotransporter protein
VSGSNAPAVGLYNSVLNVSHSVLNGNVATVWDSSGTLTLTDSILNGCSPEQWNDGWVGYTNDLTLILNGTSTWNMTDSSWVTNLTNNATVNFVNLGDTLTIGHLDGNGVFHLETNFVAGTTDFIHILGTAEGSFKIIITNLGNRPKGQEAPLHIVQLDGANNGVSFSGSTLLGVGMNQFKAEVYTEDEANWYVGLIPTGNASNLGSDVINTIVGNNDSFVNSLEQLGGQFAVNRNGLDWSASPAGFSKGGGKNTKGTRDWNVWAQTYGQQRNYHLPNVHHMRAIFWGVAVGADKAFDLDANNKLITGIFGAYDGSHFDLRQNQSKAEGYGIGGGVYASWAERSGWYADALVKVSRLHQDLKSDESANFSNTGIGAKVEAGKRFDLNAGWFIEPSASVTYAHLMGYDLSVASVESTNVYRFRAGTALGKRIADVTVFTKLAAADQESSGGKIKDGLNEWTTNSNGLRAELTLGAAWAINADNTFSVSYNTSFGSKYTQPWGVNAGFSHKF